MGMVYYTKNLNEKMYTRLVETIIMHLDPGVSTREFMSRWTIAIRPLSQVNTQFFEHIKSTSGTKINSDMPSGVTGKYVIDLFMHDDSNIMKFRENADRIQHELCHAKLYNTMGFVAAVHNKIGIGGNIIKGFKIPFWTNRWKFWQQIPINIIDVRREIEGL